MIARIHKALREREREGGFTLIELLVVMIIIGILAAIAIPLFLNQKQKATETGNKSDAQNIYKEIAAFEVDGQLASIGVTGAPGPVWTMTASYVGGTPANETTTVRSTSGSTVAVTAIGPAAAPTDFCVTVTNSANGANPWSADGNGLVSGTTCP